MKIIYEQESFTISSTVKNAPRVKGVFFHDIKNKALGKDYELSLVFVGKTRARSLNKTHRHKDYATDILSFTLDKTTGEIFIYPQKAKSKSKEFGKTFQEYLPFLFIHGLFHLKGFDHGSRMEGEEARIRRLFKV